MSWRILYVEKNNFLSLYLDNVKIKTEGKESIILPLRDINTIVIDNRESLFTCALVAKCAEYNVCIVVCDDRHLPVSTIMPLSGNYRSSRMLESQMLWKGDVLGFVWKKIVQAKICNQANVLETKGVSRAVLSRMRLFAEETLSFDERNCEGLAAKMYFRALFGEEFYRERECSINAALNYGYSIFRSALARALVARGLNPQRGIFHRGASNSFNLADDLLEPFRPMVDLWVSRNVSEISLFSRECRLSLVRLPTERVLWNGKRVTALMAMEKMIDGLLGFFESGDEELLIFPKEIFV